MEKRKFEYIIKVEGKEVWRGPNPKNMFDELRKKNPGKEVGISVDSGDYLFIGINHGKMN